MITKIAIAASAVVSLSEAASWFTGMNRHQVVSNSPKAEPVKAEKVVEAAKSLDLRDFDKLEAFKKEGLKMKVGDSVKILLSSNPSTGFNWMVDDGKHGDFCSVALNYVQDAAPANFVGVGGR